MSDTMLGICMVCGGILAPDHVCDPKLEDRIENGRQANSELRGDVPPTWNQRHDYGWALLRQKGDME